MTWSAHTANLHSEHGARRGEHLGRRKIRVIKVHDIAWLEFEKPDLLGAEAFAHAFASPPCFGPKMNCDCGAPMPHAMRDRPPRRGAADSSARLPGAGRNRPAAPCRGDRHPRRAAARNDRRLDG